MRYLGHVSSNELPFKAGDVVVIPAGVVVKSMHPSKHNSVNVRRRKVRIDHFLPGRSINPLMFKKTDFDSRHHHHWDEQKRLLDEAHLATDDAERSRLYRAAYEYKAHIENPSIRWPGEGGYWCEADLNDILVDPVNAVFAAA